MAEFSNCIIILHVVDWWIFCSNDHNTNLSKWNRKVKMRFRLSVVWTPGFNSGFNKTFTYESLVQVTYKVYVCLAEVCGRRRASKGVHSIYISCSSRRRVYTSVLFIVVKVRVNTRSSLCSWAARTLTSGGGHHPTRRLLRVGSTRINAIEIILLFCYPFLYMDNVWDGNSWVQLLSINRCSFREMESRVFMDRIWSSCLFYICHCTLKEGICHTWNVNYLFKTQ